MTPGSRKSSARKQESGYALILVMFFLALLVVGLAAAAPTVLSNLLRERETEMIWRGNQYARGIRLYFSKMKRFPTGLDDLTKPKTGIRFMRHEYKDPMNLVDGSWRLIYIGPNGQLIGSLNNSRLGGAQANGSSLLALLSTSSGKGAVNPASSSSSTLGFGMSQAQGGPQISAAGMTMSDGVMSSKTAGPADGSSTDDPLQPHSLTGAMDGSNTVGGYIVGVGSKVNRKSFLVYHEAKNYKLFEFICEPSVTGGASAGIGTMDGANPVGPSTPYAPFYSGSNAGALINQTLFPTPPPSQSPNPGIPPGPGQAPTQPPAPPNLNQ